MSEFAVRIVVSGRVQGVGFRAWTRREATTRGLAGSAVNRPDGSVEIHAEGDRESCDDLVTVLRGDATPGTVDGVAVDVVEPSGATGFAVG